VIAPLTWVAELGDPMRLQPYRATLAFSTPDADLSQGKTPRL
jgi:hypothetical protein